MDRKNRIRQTIEHLIGELIIFAMIALITCSLGALASFITPLYQHFLEGRVIMKLNGDDIFFIILVVSATIMIPLVFGITATAFISEIFTKVVDILLTI